MKHTASLPRVSRGVVFPQPQHVRRAPCLFSANVLNSISSQVRASPLSPNAQTGGNLELRTDGSVSHF